eukprot:TRINITY_DN12419_c0_g1_i1.p1 TRINITY_DN12419_c0_g1~~TRINITY_DN12419_c0_g1_i1.p1  ORF type:complete len:180 (-),score=23.90 TRINITY_DN12419_c0_g1_i1:210-749(-)
MDKNTLQTPFPNLPYLVLPDRIITESDTIMHWAAISSGRDELLGKGAVDTANVTGYRSVLADLLGNLVKAAFFEKSLELVIKAVNEKGIPVLTAFNKILEGKNFLIGDYITLADCSFLYVLDFRRQGQARCPHQLPQHLQVLPIPQRIPIHQGLQSFREMQTSAFLQRNHLVGFLMHLI